MMGGWPMGVRFMGHTTCPHVRAVANTDHGLCGASKVVKTATDGPCGVAARGCAASGAMATHGTMQTHDVTLHVSYHSNRMWRHHNYFLRCWGTVSIHHNADAHATMQ